MKMRSKFINVSLISLSVPYLPISLSPLLKSFLWLISLGLFLAGCSEIRAPKPTQYISITAPPHKQEFRWSNGKMPKSFDPALASASPETDVIRAIYEGLTDLDPKSLKPVPAIAVKWTSSEDFKTWTFQLRHDAKWSNGQPVTSQDFVRSWKRLAELGAKVSQRDLLKNIVGMDTQNVLPIFSNKDEDIFTKELDPANVLNVLRHSHPNANATGNPEHKAELKTKAKDSRNLKIKKSEIRLERIKKNELDFGVEAVNPNVLKVTLKQGDESFPLLVAHPIFRPIFGESKDMEATDLSTNIITDGAFQITSVATDGIVLERSATYWNKGEVDLERVKFVATESAENALERYRAGDIDVVTNANFAPLALKLLTPYDELRRTRHSALNFYEFNLSRKPFDDYRVREALAIAIERERLTEDEIDGAAEPALSFLPFDDELQLSQSAARARKLLADAGFANGINFPTVRLLVNRNDLQKRIAGSVARMWKKNLNIETEIIVKDPADFQAAVQNGGFDVVRRGIVLPTADETANMLAMFGSRIIPEEKTKQTAADQKTTGTAQPLIDKTAESKIDMTDSEISAEETGETNAKSSGKVESPGILTEKQALQSLPAIPLYFPSSYSLVKPYVQGFDSNALDAPSLKNVKIDNNWQPSNPKILSNGQN